MAREKYEADEASMVEQMAERPKTLKASMTKDEKPAQQIPEQMESPPTTEESLPDEPQISQPRRESSKRKRGQVENYDEVFLKRKELKTRQSVYISQEIHASIARLVHVLALAGKEISVGGYIDNVLSEHLDSHKEAIAEMYRKQLDQFL